MKYIIIISFVIGMTIIHALVFKNCLKQYNFNKKFYKQSNTKVGAFMLNTLDPTTIFFINNDYFFLDTKYIFFKKHSEISRTVKSNKIFNHLLNTYLKFLRANIAQDNLVLLLNDDGLSEKLAHSDLRAQYMVDYFEIIQKYFIIDNDNMKIFPYIFKKQIYSKLKPFSSNINELFLSLQFKNKLIAFPKITDKKILNKAKRLRFICNNQLLLVSIAPISWAVIIFLLYNFF